MEYLKQPETDPFSSEEVKDEISETVKNIIEQVRSEGDNGVLELTSKYDGVDRSENRLTKTEQEEAINRLTTDERRIIDNSLERIQDFAEAQLESIEEFELTFDDGSVLGQKVIPIDRAGAYVPGGEYPLLSSALMTVTPPAVAGVEKVVVATPPQDDGIPHPAVIYGALQAGADEIYVMGGAQAISALALGTDEVPSVDKVLGPGNAFVTEAKRQLFGTVGIDLLAGPSEILVICDETADPDVIAADLLAQAEHDPASRPLLVTTSRTLGETVIDKVHEQLDELKTEEIARDSWRNMGMVAVTDNLEEAVTVSNNLAAEHVEVHTETPNDLLDELRNYGTLFLGENSANVYSDKLVGTNHTLPTGRSARYTSGLSVHSVLKTPTYQHLPDDSIESIEPWATKQSVIENLDGHAKSSYIRREGGDLENYDSDDIRLPSGSRNNSTEF